MDVVLHAGEKGDDIQQTQVRIGGGHGLRGRYKAKDTESADILVNHDSWLKLETD